MSFPGNFPRFSKVSADGKEIYFGDPDTDGSYRLSEVGGSIHLAKRVASAWVDQGDIVTAAGGATYNVIADDLVDFDADVNFIEITADKSLGAKNLADGKTTMLIVKNTDASSHLVSFDSGSFGTNSADNTVAVPSGQNNVYACQGFDGGALAVLLKDDVGNPFPTGVDGDLTILNGQTVQLTAGDIKDYDNIDIQAGGTLEIIDPSSTGNLTEIYARTSFNIDGQLIGRSMPNGASGSGTTASGYAYSYSIPQNNGGNGGDGYYDPNTGGAANRGIGGSQSGGLGGGGGGGQIDTSGLAGLGCTPTGPFNSGNGGTPTGNGQNGPTITASCPSTPTNTAQPGPGGAGGNGSFFNGQNAFFNPAQGFPYKGGDGGAGAGGGGAGGPCIVSLTFTESCIRGGGGGGGAGKGTHGSSVLLWCSSGITGSGSVDLSGTGGGNGGAGAEGREDVIGFGGSQTPVQKSGGGGGGGAGGSGGTLYYKALSFSPATNVSGGSGGSGGGTGPQTFPPGAVQAQNGGAGSNGTAGAVIVIP